MKILKMFRGAGGGGGNRTPSRTPDNLLSQDYVELILITGKGPWKGLAPGIGATPENPKSLQNLFFGTTSLENVSTGKSNFADFEVTQFFGDDDDPEIERVLGGDSSNLTVGTPLSQNVPVVRTTPNNLRATNDFAGINRLEVRLLFSALVREDDDGTHNHTAHFRIEYKATTSGTWLFYQNDNDLTVYGKTTSGYVKDFLIDVVPLTNADYEVRVTKLSADNGVQEVVEMSWESLQMVTLARPTYPGVAKMHMYGRVSEQFSSLPDISGIYDTQIIWIPNNYNPETRTYDETPPWDGGLVRAFSNNPAWVLYFLIMDPNEGLAAYYPNVSVVLQEFYEAGKWCDEQVPGPVVGETQPRFTFDEVFTDQRLGLELLSYVAGSFNSTIFDYGDMIIRLRTDKPGTALQVFTPENVTEEGFNYTFTDISTRYNDVSVQFINPDLNWEVDERKATIDASEWIEKNGRIPLSFTAVGCTNAHEAIRRANERLIVSNTETATVSFQTTRLGNLLELYKTILIADPVNGWSSGGRIKSYAAGVIQLRDPLFFEATTSCVLKIQTYTGISEVTVQPPSTGLVYSLNIVSGTFPSNIPDKTVFTLENTTNIGVSKPFRVMAIEEVDKETYRINALEINPDKYEDAANGTVSEPVVYDYTVPGEPVLPLNLFVENTPPLVSSDGSLTYQVRLSWSRPPNSYTSHYEIDWTLVDSGVTRTEKVYADEVNIEPLQDGGYYDFKLFAITPVGRRSARSVDSLNFEVTKKNSILENVTGLAVARIPNGWQATWNSPTAVPDLAGTRIKFSSTVTAWESLPNLYLSPSKAQELPWFTAGTIRVQAKYINTSGNESGTAQLVSVTVLPPAQPTVVVNTTVGATELTFNNCATTQPLLEIQVRKGNATSTWDTATISQYSVAATQRTLTVIPDALNMTRVFLRAVDVAGNLGAITLVEIAAAANSVSGVLAQLQGDIDETWITPGLLDHIDFGDPNVEGSLADRLDRLESTTPGLFNAQNAWDFNGSLEGWANFSTTNFGTLVLSAQNNSAVAASSLSTTSSLQELIIKNDFPSNFQFLGSRASIVRIRLRKLSGVWQRGHMFYATLGGHSYSNSFYKALDAEPDWGTDGWAVVEWDTRTLTVGDPADWTSSTISGFRFDFNRNAASANSFEIDWIAVGSVGPALSQAVFQNEVTAREDGDSANASNIITVQSRLAASEVAGTSLWNDPAVKNTALWLVASWGTLPTATTFEDGSTGWRSPTGAQASVRGLTRVPVVSGRKYRVSAQVRSSVTTPNGRLYLRFDYGVTPTGAYGNGHPTVDPTIFSAVEGSVEAILPPTTWQRYSWIVTPASLATYLSPMVLLNYTGTTGYMDARDIRIEDVTDVRDLTSTVQTEISTRVSETGWLGAQWATKIALTVGGVPVIGGIAIAGYSSGTAGATFDMTIRSNKIAFMPPAGSSDVSYSPFIYYATNTVVNGVTIPSGLYLKNAFIEYISADKIDTRNLTVKDSLGNIILQAGAVNLASTYINPANGWLNSQMSLTTAGVLMDGATVRGGVTITGLGYIGNLNATASVVLLNGNGMTIVGSEATKTGGTNNAWDSGFRSKDSYAGGCYVSFVTAQANLNYMIGLNQDPTTDNSYVSIDYALYLLSTGSIQRHGQVTGAGTVLGTYVAGDILAITYDGINFRSYKNGALIDTYAASITAPLFVDSSFYATGAKATNIQFGPMSSIKAPSDAAAAAQVAADAANTLLTNIASDNILSPVEKPSIVQEYNVLNGEKTGIETTATTYGITTEKTNYTNAVTALTSYLATLTTPILWSTVTGDTTIVGTTFRTNFQTVYSTRQILLNKIADLANSRINSAQADADAAQADADSANVLLSDIASDSKLTPVEKSDIRREWTDIYNEKAGINTTATTYGITTENTNYNNAIQTLGTYLNGGTAYTIGATPPLWITDAQLSVTTTIVGSTFRTNFAAVYTARQALLNKIAELADTRIDASQVAADNAQADADAANLLIADIASDSKLTPVEKSDIRREWTDIYNEKAGINTTATTYGITTENTNYNNAIQTLGTYLNGGTAYTIGATPPLWITDAQLSVTTTIVGSTFRTNFAAVYTARQALLNKINATAVNPGNKISGTNVTTFIADAAIKSAQIESLVADKVDAATLSAITAQIGLLRTATTGARVEVQDNQIRVYDSANVLRVRLGVW